MQIPLVPLAVLTVVIWEVAKADELLSARCQAKCLHDLEMRAKEDSELKRHLKHHIVNVCKDDANCSSCAIPCRESFVDIHDCQKKICKDLEAKHSCRQSCEYLQRIYAEKPGVCPQPTKVTPSDECSALCRLDGDCPEAMKCCTVGCSRRCLEPHTQDPRLLPIPTRVSVQERKRKRSAVVRWIMQQLKRHHTTSNANLYVLQWRWSVRKDETTMTDWQTIMVRNKMYAIMKHLLSPGRYYMFRVAAVNVHGSLGFSVSSPPFKLSKEARAPGQPRDLSLSAATEDTRGLWTQKLVWTPPLSDLPIKNYILSWQKSTIEEANSFEELMRRRSELERQGKRSATHGDDELDSDESFAGREQFSVTIPSFETSAYVQGLAPDSVYLVEVHACVDSSDGELHGEKAIAFIRTSLGSTIPTTNATEEDDTDIANLGSALLDLPKNPTDTNKSQTDGGYSEIPLEIKTPYYEEGDLKTVVSWLNSKHCSPDRTTFKVRWRLLYCKRDGSDKRTFYDLDTSGEDWAEMSATECVAVLDELEFGCTYSVEVWQEGSSKELTASGRFLTGSCDSTPSAERIACSYSNQRHNALFCSTDAQAMRAECSWRAPRLRSVPHSAAPLIGTEDNSGDRTETLVGFRIALTAAEEALNNVTISPPHERNIRFLHLHPSTVYTVYVQAITHAGLDDTMKTSFSLISSTSDSSERPEQHIPKGSPERNGGSDLMRVSPSGTSSSSVSETIADRFKEDTRIFDDDDERHPDSALQPGDGLIDPRIVDTFPGAEIIELPLESGACSVDVRWLLSPLTLFVLFMYSSIFRLALL